MIDLTTPFFWVALALGVALLVGIRTAAPRSWVLSVLNLLFLASLLREQVVGLLAGILIAYALLQAIGRGYRVLAVVIGVGTAALFILNKRPDVAAAFGASVAARTLAAIGYSYVALRLVEVTRAVFEGRHPAPNLPALVNFFVPFHMLAAGPIQAYDDYVQQEAVPAVRSLDQVLTGVERIAAGLFKKFVIAYLIHTTLLTDFAAPGWYRVLEVQAFFVWLYLDFSAYSDIAAGAGMLMGVATPENFNRPLLSRNVIDFWERWHISLSLFIRRNLFIPIQVFLMRREWSPLNSAVVGVIISFVLCGLWHGLSLGFLLWGIAQASGLVITRVYSHILQQRLGRQGVKTYLANRWIAAVSTFVTFEFQAWTQLTLFIA